jgi:hypothetical protein
MRCEKVAVFTVIPTLLSIFGVAPPEGVSSVWQFSSNA